MKLLSARMDVQNPKDAELMAQAQAVIVRQTENLTRMIDDMLSAAQAEVQPESPLSESGGLPMDCTIKSKTAFRSSSGRFGI